MRLCITEKPSVAQDIAKILGANTRRDGYFEGGEWCVTWTYGHLCTLKEPHDYTPAWKQWSFGALPMIPGNFGIKLIDIQNYKRQFNAIAQLAASATEIINCGDAGQEGELIQRWVMQKAGVKCPVRRLWISSLTDDAIREGFQNLRPQADFDNLYFAGLSRAIGDWLLGMNATRLYSLKYAAGGGVLSVGRVQTPTLALIVNRQLEIDNFRPEDFWELKTLYRGVTFSSTKGRFKTEQAANEALQTVKGQPFTIKSVAEKHGKEAPPKLFDLTTLQVECNKKWGWSAEETLRLIQTLYEKKVTTYPRVDTTYLSEDIHAKVPDILRRMTPYAPLTASLLSAPIIKPKRIFDNSKVADHHAIIPTGQSPTVLAGDEKKMYHLIARRFIAAFYPDAQVATTTVMAESAGVEFKATGRVITSPGWRSVYAGEQVDAPKDDDEASVMPPMTEGEQGPHEPSLQKKQTQPPKPYNEGTLLRAMEGAGKTVDDEALREAMKENGIGRPSTRAAIIETLFKRRYIRRQRKAIVPTQAGIDLIATIHDPLLKSAKLTGIWENKLRRIERGEYAAADFIAELKQMVTEVVHTVMTDAAHATIATGQQSAAKAAATATEKPTAEKPAKPRAARIHKFEQVLCPKCGKGHILKGRTAFGCSRYAEGCDMLLPFDQYPADSTPSKLAKLIKKAK